MVNVIVVNYKSIAVAVAVCVAVVEMVISHGKIPPDTF